MPAPKLSLATCRTGPSQQQASAPEADTFSSMSTAPPSPRGLSGGRSTGGLVAGGAVRSASTGKLVGKKSKTPPHAISNHGNELTAKTCPGYMPAPKLSLATCRTGPSQQQASAPEADTFSSMSTAPPSPRSLSGGDRVECRLSTTPARLAVPAQSSDHKVWLSQLEREVVAERMRANSQQRAHDQQVMGLLDPRDLPKVNRNPSAHSPRPAASAFTDRSCRMREGLGCQAALMNPDSDLAREKPDGHGLNCECAKCKPYDKHSAGQFSTVLNERPLYGTASGGRKLHHEMDTDASKEELDFRKCLRRRIRSASPRSPGGGSMHQHREAFPGQPTDSSPIAGDFDRRIEVCAVRGRQAWQGRPGDEPSRGGAVMALSPSPRDPSPPTKIASQKADGEFKQGYSSQVEKLSAHRSPSIFRYEPGMPQTPQPRARSVPPAGDVSPTAGKTTQAQERERGVFAWQYTAASEASPQLTPRGRQLNNSAAMSELTNLSASAECAASARRDRLQADKPFRDLCRQAEEAGKHARSESAAIAAKHSPRNSAGAAGALRWD